MQTCSIIGISGLQNGLPFFHHSICQHSAVPDSPITCLDPDGVLLKAFHPGRTKLAGCVSHIAAARLDGATVACTTAPEKTYFVLGDANRPDFPELDELISIMQGADLAASRVRCAFAHPHTCCCVALFGPECCTARTRPADHVMQVKVVVGL